MPDRRAAWRALLAAVMAIGLAACGGTPRAAAPDPVPARLHHPNPGPAGVTLMTVINSQSGMGDHAALLIDGSHRAIYDPAGSFELAALPRRHDVIYGVTPALEQVYLGYHARATHHVVAQSLPLDRAAADGLIALAEAQPAATAGFCAVRAGAVLRSLPGMAGLSRSPWPQTLNRSFGAMPGVTTRIVTATDVPLAARTRGPGFVDDATPPPARAGARAGAAGG